MYFMYYLLFIILITLHEHSMVKTDCWGQAHGKNTLSINFFSLIKFYNIDNSKGLDKKLRFNFC